MYVKKYATNRKTEIFVRENDDISFGQSVAKECNLFKNQISSDTLVLSFFNKLNTETKFFKAVYKLIDTDVMVLDAAFCDNKAFLLKTLPSIIDKSKSVLLTFLTSIETGITDISYDKENEDIYVSHNGVDKKHYRSNLFN